MSVTARTNVFLSYSSSDEPFLLELMEHLKPFERSGSISKWSDKDVVPGSNRRIEVQAALRTAKVAVLLVSSSFLASDFIHEHELGPLLKEAETGGVRILWLHVRSCAWKETPLKNYQPAISADVPLAEMKAERDKAWVKICESIEAELDPSSRSSLRQLINSVLLTSSDFDAFCSNYFPDVHQYFTREVDRQSKLTLLLALGGTAQIRSGLRAAYPARVDFFEEQQRGPRPKDPLRPKPADRLRELLRKRAILLEYGADSTRIESEIEQERKALRRGPRVKKGEVLSERFQLVQKINQGAYGEIWLAYDLKSDSDVAVKILHGKWNDRKDIVSRFAEVAAQIASISHPHVLSVLHPVTEWEEFHYYVMEYLAGGDLHQAVLRDRDKDKKRNYLGNLLQIGQALAYLHSKGLIHRDVKPQNILLDSVGLAKISDFDLLGGDLLKRSTETGEARGTFLYAAPEQFGNVAHADARADIHALGRTALFVLHGEDLPANAGDDRVRFVESLPLANELKKILIRATEPEPAKRYPSIAEFCAEFAAVLTSPDALSRVPGVAPAQTIEGVSFDDVTALSLVPDTDKVATVPEPSSADVANSATNATAALSLPAITKEPKKSSARSRSIFSSQYGIYAAILSIFVTAFFVYKNTKHPAPQPDVATTSPNPFDLAVPSAPLSLPDLFSEKPVDAGVSLSGAPDLQSAIDKTDEPKYQPLKKTTPKSDSIALKRAIPRLKKCLSTSAMGEIVIMRVKFKVNLGVNNFLITNGSSFNVDCMEKVIKKISFPEGDNERVFVANYVFTDSGDNVEINEPSGDEREVKTNKTIEGEIISMISKMDLSQCSPTNEPAEIKLTFTSNGRLFGVRALNTPDAVIDCIVKKLGSLSFPEFTGPEINITHKFYFTKPTL